MIRRRAGESFRLIAQDDHARLSGQLAAAVGNDEFAPPTRGEETVSGIALHDCGWPIHDEAPQLNDAGLPSDVFETPLERAVMVWEMGAARAEAQAAPYSALLVSLHVLRLSGGLKPKGNRQGFELIRFQNHQAQRQMRLREQIGMRTDRPLHQGLPLPAGPGVEDPAEQALIYDAGLTAAMDLLSLCLCCTEPPSLHLGPLPRRPAGPTTVIRVERPTESLVRLSPWPFNVPALRVQIPFRAVPARAYASTNDLHAHLAEAPNDQWTVELQPSR